jgi:hypothetical protein
MGVEEVRRDAVARKKCVAFRSSGRGVTRKTRKIKPAATLQIIRNTSPMNSAMRVAAQSVRVRRAVDTIVGVVSQSVSRTSRVPRRSAASVT